jgi:hypothetical protein
MAHSFIVSHLHCSLFLAIPYLTKFSPSLTPLFVIFTLPHTPLSHLPIFIHSVTFSPSLLVHLIFAFTLSLYFRLYLLTYLRQRPACTVCACAAVCTVRAWCCKAYGVASMRLCFCCSTSGQYALWCFSAKAVISVQYA